MYVCITETAASFEVKYQQKMEEAAAAKAEANQIEEEMQAAIKEFTNRRNLQLERSRLAGKEAEDLLKCVRRAKLDLRNLLARHEKK